MIRKEDQYFKVNKVLLLTIGLWPFQQSNFTRFQHIFISAIFTTFITFQLTAFATLNCTSELFMKILSFVSLFTVSIVKYYVFLFHIEGVKDLLMQIQYVRNELKDKNETAIIKKYDCIAKRYTVALTSKTIFIVFKYNGTHCQYNM
ncbi:uncharacterized protein LOC112454871 [Temnothorax curvispinosus]|uniref:Uncharacterized protein LOC112454871 n=1 Tax=Temnothorax curvispinosus TaxID=300111 RepID=A0A6J1PTQ9_9HYME|nr:uncharacterized protein LOC112454871 [Temnothorax curvispinosus]